MVKVFFKPVSNENTAQEKSETAKQLLVKLIDEEKITLKDKVPLKVHFGEKGNITFLGSDHYVGIIDLLKEKEIESCYIETNVLYAGQRSKATNHRKIAEKHGFDELPIIIADGENGEENCIVEIPGKHFQKCFLGKGFEDFSKFIVLSHFKGHRMAGFGGAMKQLAMGFASSAGKMYQHSNARPLVIPFLCNRCGACIKYCPVSAISKGWIKAKIDPKKCTGCAGCIAICRKNAILPNFFKSFSGSFIERVTEYAYAAQLNRENIYINFAINITKGCDCEGFKMKPIIQDIGIFASTDPVAIDQACMDKIDQINGKPLFKKGRNAFPYAEKLGMGQTEYELVEL
ncbi:DUF362 domain-containing protein [bacterium]|nr:DUF362 domain-containing protein [bacterium]